MYTTTEVIVACNRKHPSLVWVNQQQMHGISKEPFVQGNQQRLSPYSRKQKETMTGCCD